MDIVYIIGTGSKWQNNELRYSLRSIAKFGANLGEVYIVGDDLPHFVNPYSVTFIKACDITTNKPALNVYYKLCRLFKLTKVERFLLSSDDHFLHHPVDFDKWPLFYKGKEMPKYNSRGVGDKRYTKTMADTRTFMEQYALDLRYWEGHINKLYDRAVWEDLHNPVFGEGFAKAMLGTEYGISCNSPMAALMHRKYPELLTWYRKDIKLKHLNSDEDWDLISNDIAFSIYDSAIDNGVAAYLKELFPFKSRFELRDH